MSSLIYGAPTASAAAEAAAVAAAASETAAAASETAAAASATSAQTAMVNRVYRFSTKAALKAETPSAGTLAKVNSPVPAYYEFKAGNYSAQVAADTWEAVYFAADGIASTSGAWVLVIDQAIDLRVYGLNALDTVDWTGAINHAWGSWYALNAEDITGEIGLSDRLNPPVAGRLFGPGSARLTAKAMPGASLVMSGLDTRVNDADDLLIRGITLHGNKANRGTATDGSGVFNEGSRNRFQDVVAREWPDAGWLMNGNTRACKDPVLEDCHAVLNDGAGVSCATVLDMRMARSKLIDNGAENLTWDHQSSNGDVTDCIFGQHKGGCGNIGIDSLGRIRFNGGLIDSGGTTDPAVGDRNGICVNSQDHATPDVVVNGMQIQGCIEAAVRVRDRSGASGTTGGDITLNGVVFRNNGTDLVVEEVSGKVLVDAATRLASVSISDASQDDVRFAGGMAGFKRTLSADQLNFPVDGSYHEIEFTNAVYDDLTGQSGNAVQLPFGRKWKFDGRVRLTGLAATGATFASYLVTFGTDTLFGNEPITADFCELPISGELRDPKATVKVEVRVGGGSGTCTVEQSSATRFTGSNI